MSIKMRQMVEKKIYTKVIDVLLDAGFYLSIDNGDNSGNDYEVKNSKDRDVLLHGMYQTDEERLYVSKRPKAGATPEIIGWVYFVYGNDGWDVISDYTVNLEKYIGEGSAVDKVVKKYED